MVEGKGSNTQEKELATGRLKLEAEDINQDLHNIITNITEAQAFLNRAQRHANQREVELNGLQVRAFEEELISKIQAGLVHYNYETGKLEGKVSYRPEILKNTSVLLNLFDRLKEERDPAVLHLDVHLLKDIVVLTMGTAVGGFTTSYLLKLPPTLGYMLGGMMAGPSCFDLISKVSQVETFGQFGAIFLLFGQGLLYSRRHQYFQSNIGAKDSGRPARGVRSAAFGYLCYTFLCFAGLIVQTPFFESRIEIVVLAVSLTLSSSTVIREFLHQHVLLETSFGRVIVEILAFQDLVIAPIAALPSLLDHFLAQWAFNAVNFQTTVLVAVISLIFVLGMIAFFSIKIILPALVQLLNLSKSHPRVEFGGHHKIITPAPELFTLLVVSFCLALSLLSEHLQMSYEVGAISAGLLMSYTPYAKQAESTLEPLTSLFGGIYLASLGMIINPMYLLAHFWEVLSWCLVVIAVKFMTGFVVLRRLGFSSVASYTAGFALGQVSEVSLFFTGKAQHMGLISRHTYLMTVATTVLLLAASPFASHAMTHVTDKDLDFTPGEGKMFTRQASTSLFWMHADIIKTQSVEEESMKTRSDSLPECRISTTKERESADIEDHKPRRRIWAD